jgi:RNA polymerase primary sigma factor
METSSSISLNKRHHSSVDVLPRRNDAPESGVLERYFRELDDERLMTPQQELEAATRILHLRQEYWKRLLGYGPFLPAIVDVIEADLPKDRKSKLPFQKLHKCMDARRERNSAKNRDAEQAVLDQFADILADVDPSNDVADMIAADVEAIAAGRGEGVRLQVRQPRRGSAPFRAFVRGLQRARLGLHAARRSFARANLRLVVTMAHRYRRNGRMSFADLIQEGNVGLMTAVDRFDPRRGFRFSTYGSWWIRHAISRALSDRGRSVRLPVHVIELQTKMSRVKREFEQKHNRPADDDELAELLGVPKEKIERFGRVLLEQDAPASQVDESGRMLGIEALADDAPEVDVTLDSSQLDEALQEALDTLRPMEADILRMRFGLDDGPGMTLREIGGIYSLSRERIRQIQERALRKLRDALENEGFCEAPEVFTEVGLEA